MEGSGPLQRHPRLRYFRQLRPRLSPISQSLYRYHDRCSGEQDNLKAELILNTRTCVHDLDRPYNGQVCKSALSRKEIPM